MATKHTVGFLRELGQASLIRIKELRARRRRGIVLLAVLVFVALLLPLIALVLTSINTEAVSTAEAIKGAKSKLAAEKALNDAIALVVNEKSYPEYYVSAQQQNNAIIVVDARSGERRDEMQDASGTNLGAGLDGVYGTADDYWVGPRMDGSYIGATDDETSARNYTYDYTFTNQHAPTYLGQGWSFGSSNKPYAYSRFSNDPIWWFDQLGAEDGIGAGMTDDDADGIPDGYDVNSLDPFVNDEPVLTGMGYYSGADYPRLNGPGTPIVRDLTDPDIEQYMYNAKVNIYEGIFSDLDRGPIPSSLLKSYANVTDEAGRINLNIFAKKLRVWAAEDSGTDYNLSGYGTSDFNHNTSPGEAGWKWIDNPLFPDRHTVAVREFDATNSTFSNSDAGGAFDDGIVDFGGFNANTGVPTSVPDGIAMPELGESVQHFYGGSPGGAGSDPYAPGNAPYSVQSMYNSLRMLLALPGVDPQLALNILTYMNPSVDALDAAFDPARTSWPPTIDPANGDKRLDAMNLTPPLTALDISITGGTVNNLRWDFEANDFDDLPLPTPRLFNSIEQLRDVPGMTEAKFRRLQDKVTVFSYDTNVIGTGLSDIPANANLVDPYVPGDPLYRGQTLRATPANLRDTDLLADLRMDVGRFTAGQTLSDYQQEAERMYAWLRAHMPATQYSKITLPVVDRMGRASIADDRMRNDNAIYAFLGGAGLMPHRDTSGATDTESGIYNVGESGHQFPLGARPGAGYPALNPQFSVESCLSILLYRNGTFFIEDDYNFSPDGALRPAANRSIFTLFGLNFFVPMISIPENSALADLFTDHNNPFYDQGTNVNPAIMPHGPGATNYAGFAPGAVYANLANPGQMDSAADLLAVPRYSFSNMSLSLMADPPSDFRSSQPGSQDGIVNYYASFSDVIPVRDYLEFIDTGGDSYDPNRVLYQLYFNFGNRPGVFPNGTWPFAVPGGSETVVIPLTARNLRAVVPVFNGGGTQSQQNVTIVAHDSYNNMNVLTAEFTSHPSYVANEVPLGAVGTLSRNFNQLEVPRPDNDGNPFGGTIDSDGNGRPDNNSAGVDWPGARPAFYQAFAYDSAGDPYISSRMEAYRWNGWEGNTGANGEPAQPERRADDVTQTYLQFNEQAEIPFRVDILPVRISGDQFEVRSAYGGAETTGGTYLLYDWTYGGADANDGTWQFQQPGQTINPQIIRVTPDTANIVLRLYDLRSFVDPGSGLPFMGPAGNLGPNVWSGSAVQPPGIFPSPLVLGMIGGYPVEGVHGGFADDTVTVTPIEALAAFRPQITNLEPAVFANEGLVDFRASSGGGDLPIDYTINIYPGTDAVTINDSPTGSTFAGTATQWLNNPTSPSYGQTATVRPASPPLVTESRLNNDTSTVFFNDVDVTGIGAGVFWVELQSQYTAPGPTVITEYCYTVLQIDTENNPGGGSGGVPPSMNASINLDLQADDAKGFVASVEMDGGDAGYNYYWELNRPVFDVNNNVTAVQIVDSGTPFVGAAAVNNTGTNVVPAQARAFTSNSATFSARFHDLDLVNNNTGTGGPDGRPDADGIYFLHCYVMDRALTASGSDSNVLAHDVAQVVVNGGTFAGATSSDSLARTPMAVLAALPPGNGETLIGINNQTPVGTAGTRPTLLPNAFGQAIAPDVAGAGDMIKLRGYNFGPTAASNRVNFAGGVSATATSAPVVLGVDGANTISEITVRVPQGAQTGPLSVSRINVNPPQTSNQLFFQTGFNVVFDLIGNVNPGVQNFLRFDLDFQGDGSIDFSYSTQTDPTDTGIVRGGLSAVEHDYASDGIGNYNATLVVTDLISGRRQVSHQLVTIRDLNPAASSTLAVVPNATVANAPGGASTIDIAGANLVSAGVRVGDRLLMLTGPATGATANVTAIPGPTALSLGPLSNGAAWDGTLVGATFSITRAIPTAGQNGMLGNIWPDVQLRSETFAARPGQGTVFRSAVGGAPAGIQRKWVLGSNSGGGNAGGGGTFITSGDATNFNFSGTNFTGRILQDTGNNFITAGVQAGDFVFNESDGGSFAVVSSGGVAATQLQMQNPNPTPAGQGLVAGAAPGRLRSDAGLQIDTAGFAAGVWTLTDAQFNFHNGSSPLNPGWHGGLVAGDGDPALVGAGAFFHNESDLTTWRVTANPLAGTPNQILVEQMGIYNTPGGVTRTVNEGLRSFTATAIVAGGGLPPQFTVNTNTLWAQLGGVVNAGVGARVYNVTQGNAEWRVIDVPNNYPAPNTGTLPGAGQLRLEYVSGGTGNTWNANDAGLIVLPAQWATNWEAAGTDDRWSVLIPVNQWRIGDLYRVETSSGPSTAEGVGQSFADATYADILAPVDFHLNLTFGFDLSSQLNQSTRVRVAWDGNFGNAAGNNLQDFFIGDTTRLNGTLDGVEAERIKITHGFGVPELLFAPGSPGGAPTRARYQVFATRSGDATPQTFGPYALPVVTVGGDDYDTNLATLNTNRYDNTQWQKVGFEASYSVGTRSYFTTDQLAVPPGLSNYANSLVSYASYDRPFFSSNSLGATTQRHQAVHGGGTSLNWVADVNADGRYAPASESPLGPNPFNGFQFLLPSGTNLMNVPGGVLVKGASFPVALPGVLGGGSGSAGPLVAQRAVYNGYAFTADNLGIDSRTFSFDSQPVFLGTRTGGSTTERLPLAADFFIDPVVGGNSQLVNFQSFITGGNAQDPSYSYQWTVQRVSGGGGPIGPTSLNANSPSIFFDAATFVRDSGFPTDNGSGVYRVFMTVSDPIGFRTAYREFELVNTPLTVNVMASPPSGSVGDTIDFFVAIDGGSAPYDVTINYGDGSPIQMVNDVGTLPTFSHVYRQPSSTVIGGVQTNAPYIVTVTVADNNGAGPASPATTEVDIAETIPLNVDLLVTPPSGVAPFSLQVHYTVGGGRRNANDGYNVLIQLLNADGTAVNSVGRSGANSFGENGQLDVFGSPANDDEPATFFVPSSGNYIVTALAIDSGGAVDTDSEDVFASGYLKPVSYGNAAPDVMRDAEGRPMHAVRVWADPFLNIDGSGSQNYENVRNGTLATNIGGGRLLEADIQVLGDLLAGDPSSNFRSLGMFASTNPLTQEMYGANYSAAQQNGQAVRDHYDTFTHGRVNINTASEDALTAVFTKIRTRRAYVLPDDTSGDLTSRYPGVSSDQASAYADQVAGNDVVDLNLNPLAAGFEQVPYAAFPPGDEYLSIANARALARDVIAYRTAFHDMHKPDAPDADNQFGYEKQNYAGSTDLGQNFRVDHLPVIGPWDGVNPKDYASTDRDAALLAPDAGTLHNAYDNLAGSYYNFDPDQFMFYSPTDIALVRQPVNIGVAIDLNGDGVPDANFRTSEEPSNYAKYLNDVSANRRWSDNRGPFYGGPTGWESSGLVPSQTSVLHSSAHSFDARNYFSYNPGEVTVNLDLLGGGTTITAVGAESVIEARNRIGIIESNGVTAYSYIPNPPFRHVMDLFKVIRSGPDSTLSLNFSPRSFPLTGAADATLDISADGLTTGRRVFSGPSSFRYEEIWSDRAGEFLPIANWLDDIAPYLTTRSYVFRVDSAGLVPVSGGSQTAMLDSAGLQRDRGMTAVVDVGPQAGRNDLYLTFGQGTLQGVNSPSRQQSYRVIYSKE